MMVTMIMAAGAVTAVAGSDCLPPSSVHTYRDHPAACRAAPAENSGKFRPITAAERAKMVRAFDKELRDGPSTRWQIEGVGGSIVCGFLNSKNAFGAYVGWKPFTFTLSESTAIVYSDDAWLFEAICHNISPRKS